MTLSKTDIIKIWQRRAAQLKENVYALYFAVRDPRVPWYAKVFGGCVIAYALSPIDLIPDFIPVLGYLDDLILLPVGIALTLKMVPPAVLAECQEKARSKFQEIPQSWGIATAIVVLWVLLATVLVMVGVNHLFQFMEQREFMRQAYLTQSSRELPLSLRHQ